MKNSNIEFCPVGWRGSNLDPIVWVGQGCICAFIIQDVKQSDQKKIWRQSKDGEDRMRIGLCWLLTGSVDQSPESMTGPGELVHELLSPSDRTGTTGKELREARLGKPD